ncbi:MAG TPA: methylase [Betaproteobacteria bacterium]|nr:methylase [Betaproteobacteria bacterium]
MTKPFAESSEQNKEPILAVLRDVFTAPGSVLEIGSGTGQHAVFFSARLPHLIWRPTELAENLPGILAWMEDAESANIEPPIELDVRWAHWPVAEADGVFSANTVHIMGWPQVEHLFRGVGQALTADGAFCLYGPFNYGGRYTSDSNARFDAWLKARDPVSGIRDIEALAQLAAQSGLSLWRDYPMPANNRILVWRKD